MGYFTAVCARRTSSSVGRDSVNQRRRFFMDVGGWGGNYKGEAHTDFGLVCGRHVVLCSWLNMHGARTLPVGSGRYPSPMETFLNARSDRGFILSAGRAHVPLAHDGELILFLPDLHLHLLRMTLCDSFKYNANFRSGGARWIASLESELAALLDLAEAQDAEIVQVGDCFEMWEVHAQLINDHITLRQVRDRTNRRGAMHRPWERMWAERKIIPRDDYQHAIDSDDHKDREAASHGLAVLVRNPDVDRLGIAIEDADAIKSAIMAKYPLLFRGDRYGSGMRFMWVQGNHDNMLANNFYATEGLSYQNNSPFKSSSRSYRIRAGGRTPYRTIKTGQNSRIWAEHGHYNDKYNRNSIFDRSGEGYDLTRSYTLGSVLGERTWHEGAALRWLGGLAYDMRPGQLRRVRQIFNENDSVRLVVMGHTHSPVLFDWDEFEACEKLEKQLNAYRHLWL